MATTNGRRVGELADEVGVSVRTLHHYDAIGLLRPSRRTDAGHRLYIDRDAARLHRIRLLQRLGLSLEEIKRAIDDPAWDAETVVADQLARLEDRIDAESRIRQRLKRAVAATSSGPRDGGDLLSVLEDLSSLDSTPRQRIAILVYRDLDAMVENLTVAFGMGPAVVSRDGSQRAVHVSIEAGDGEVWLHPEAPAFGLVSPHTAGAATATTAVMVDDVDAHHERAVGAGSEIVYPPMDQPYGYREYSARDIEGGLWSFMKPLA